MEGTEYKTKEDVLKRAQEATGLTLGEIDKTGRLKTGKGAVGTVIEESWFGYSPNSESEPDFPEAGVELKVTPYIKNKGKIRAKERLVCNMIDYITECNKTFETSAFWHKCNTMLIMSYEYRKGIEKKYYTIDRAILFNFPEEDRIIIKNDWKIIVAKIRSGKAHLITEADTMYLAACTKGANSKSVREQPFNTIKAKKRAYSLKSSYMTHILNAYVFGTQKDEHIIKNWRELQGKSFEDYIMEKIKPYVGFSQDELKRMLHIDSNAKNLNELLLARMLGVKGKVSDTEEFKNAKIEAKTIRVQKNGKIRESMSFSPFKFTEIVNESWENSKLKNQFETTKYLLVIFMETESGQYKFEGVRVWNMPAEDLEELHVVWKRTVEVIKQGVKFVYKGKKRYNNLPNMSENRVAHVRPHARNANDTYPLPDGRSMTKQSFWLNSTYLESILNTSGWKGELESGFDYGKAADRE